MLLLKSLPGEGWRRCYKAYSRAVSAVFICSLRLDRVFKRSLGYAGGKSVRRGENDSDAVNKRVLKFKD